MRKWIKVLDKLPPENLVVETKLHDEKGVRNVQKLIRIKNLWFLPFVGVYVYYTPTHWREI